MRLVGVGFEENFQKKRIKWYGSKSDGLIINTETCKDMAGHVNQRGFLRGINLTKNGSGFLHQVQWIFGSMPNLASYDENYEPEVLERDSDVYNKLIAQKKFN